MSSKYSTALTWNICGGFAFVFLFCVCCVLEMSSTQQPARTESWEGSPALNGKWFVFIQRFLSLDDHSKRFTRCVLTSALSDFLWTLYQGTEWRESKETPQKRLSLWSLQSHIQPLWRNLSVNPSHYWIIWPEFSDQPWIRNTAIVGKGELVPESVWLFSSVDPMLNMCQVYLIY